MEGNFKFAIVTILGALVLSAIFMGLRATALKNAYDVSSEFNVTDSAGTVHTVEASPISGDLVALLYSIGAGLVWLIAILLIVLKFVGKI
jgi:hypothetical protein